MKAGFKSFSAALAIATLATLGLPQSSFALTFGTTGSPVADGSSYFSSQGSCGSSGGNVSFSLVNSSGTSTPLGTSASTSYNSNTNTYDFNSTNLSIPSTYATGPTSLVVTCPNGQMYSTPITVLASNRDLLNFGTGEGTVRGPVTVSGFCSGSNNNGTVTFSLSNGSTSTSIPGATASASGSNGAFTATVSMPSTIQGDLATLTATCPNGDTSSILTVLGDPTSGANLGAGTGTGNGAGSGTGVGTDVGGSPEGNTSGSEGMTGTTGVIPVGGVEAGSGSTTNNFPTAAALITTLLAATAYGAKKFSNKSI
jgi:hypothetical protein